MPQGWIKSLPMVALLVAATVTLSGCNTISGTVGGIGRDISAVGNALGGDASDCRQGRCGGYKRSCGPQGCRQLRQVVTGCPSGNCGRSYRETRYKPYASRDRYSRR